MCGTFAYNPPAGTVLPPGTKSFVRSIYTSGRGGLRHGDGYGQHCGHRVQGLPVGLVSWWAANNTLDNQGVNNGLAQGNLGYTNGEVGLAFQLTAARLCLGVHLRP